MRLGAGNILQSALIVSGVVMTSAGVSVSAELDSGWFTKSNVRAFNQQMTGQGMYPEKIDCRFYDPRNHEFAVKIKYARNTKNRDWKWSVGTIPEMREYEADAARRHLKRAYRKRIRHPRTGEFASCVVFWGPDNSLPAKFRR